ncbi:hypothetical protein MHYP_G00098820 [Metynnis hypsauchen]
MKKDFVFILLLHLQQIWTDMNYKHCVHWTYSKGYDLPDFTERVVLNDVTIYYYDSQPLRRKMPCPEWINSTTGREHWNTVHKLSDHNKRVFYLGLQSAIKQFNLTGLLSDHNIYQASGCCLLYPNGTHEAQLTHAFNGKDFISFDINRKTFVAAVPQAVVYKNLREREHAIIDEVATYYKTMCLERLHIFKKAPGIGSQKVPEVRIFEKQKAGSIKVTCHVTGFYPQVVQVDWLGPDLHFVDGGVTDVLPNEDGTYQTRKSVTVQEEDVGKHTYSCVVLHSSVAHNITTVWVGEKHSGIAVWTSLACICFLAAGTGFVIWRRCRTRDAVI